MATTYRGMDRAALDGAYDNTSAVPNVQDYRDRGYPPAAVLNYIVRFGWSYGDQEIFSRDELVRAFNWDRVRNGAWNLMSPAARAANTAAKGQPVKFIQPSAPASKRASSGRGHR